MANTITNPELVARLAELDQLTNWEQRPRGGMRVGLEPMRDLAGRLNDPQRNFRVIHVAGTKGKSSTCALLEAGLARAGHAVGRYSSPHVSYVGERITLNGKPVGEADLAMALGLCLAALRAARTDGTAGRDATWFDVLTATAFVIYRRAGVEWAVIETGLGGRLDSTNIVESEVAVITNIELEHTEVLGKTRAAIAFEKAGIIKPGSIVVTPLAEADEAGAVIAARARELGCALLRPIVPETASIMAGNAIVAGTVLDALGARHGKAALGAWLLDPDTINAARLPGRLELLTAEVTTDAGTIPVPVALDGAHVPFNLAAVMADLRKLPAFAGPCVAVVSFADDKDALGLLTVLARYPVSIIFTIASARSRPPADLSAMAEHLGLKTQIEPDPRRAYDKALNEAARTNAWVLVTGSLYLVGAVAAEGQIS
ncbi:folylpolyglutamate synthase/dihydrofolate synthase family protein [Pleomorphomonas sp. PLEO]|uniref:bifunctional folylpolyglutamate synthase/dihydrofolate synthase n=1 Tax=Pleomorphomonas sp. PLEO TaxID=3239306 RepID=UPI00351DDCA8